MRKSANVTKHSSGLGEKRILAALHALAEIRTQRQRRAICRELYETPGGQELLDVLEKRLGLAVVPADEVF